MILIFASERDARYKKWRMAVQRSLGWASEKMSLQMTGNKKYTAASRTEHVDSIKDSLVDSSSVDSRTS